MLVRKALVATLQQHTVRFFLKGPGSTLIVTGTLVLAGAGAAALNQPSSVALQPVSSTAGPQSPAALIPPSSAAPQPVSPTAVPRPLAESRYWCFSGQGGAFTIPCPTSVQYAKLPIALGNCRATTQYPDGLIVCEVTADR